MSNQTLYSIHIILQILYEDGDVEVLRLDKERWELIETGGKPAKVLRLSGILVLLSIYLHSPSQLPSSFLLA